MTTRLIHHSDSPDFEKELEYAAEVIRSGGLVVFPTETVYGLGADATSETAAEKIYLAKGRPSDNPLIIHIAKPEDATPYAYTDECFFKLAEAFMPGALTVVLPAKPTIPERTRAGLDTVAVRCPENPIARRLIELSGVPIAAPSANLSGSPSPTRPEHVIADMSGRADVIIDGGECDIGIESTIIKLNPDGGAILLRPGRITEQMLLPHLKYLKVAPAVTDALKEGEVALSPGMKYRHYAPRAPLYLVSGDSTRFLEYLKSRPQSLRIAVIAYDGEGRPFEDVKNVSLFSFGGREDELYQAHLLFDLLRRIDLLDYDEIYAPLPRAEGIGLALYNRMIRAAAHQIIRM